MTLLAHAPLQKSLQVTTYSPNPDANGIHNVSGYFDATLSAGTPPSFVPTSSVGEPTNKEKLIVSGLTVKISNVSTNFDGTYTLTKACSLKPINPFLLTGIPYDQSKPVFKHDSKNIYIAYIDQLWFACSSSAGDALPQSAISTETTVYASNAEISIDGLSTVQSFDRPYPSKLGTFSHNFNQNRVSLMDCLELTPGKKVTFTGTPTYFSFWAFSDNK